MATAASAATPSGYALDGQDPYATGCNVGAYVISQATIHSNAFNLDYGTAYLWWSPACQTNWVSATVSRGGGWAIETDMYRQNPSHWELYTWNASLNTGNLAPGDRSWSNMVYAPTSCVLGDVNTYYPTPYPSQTWSDSEGSATVVQPGCTFS
jgi:Protein of unknown function (DUF2690)